LNPKKSKKIVDDERHLSYGRSSDAVLHFTTARCGRCSVGYGSVQRTLVEGSSSLLSSLFSSDALQASASSERISAVLTAVCPGGGDAMAAPAATASRW
jgi:hypothetical protein